MEECGLFPNCNVSWAEVREIVSPNSIHISIALNDVNMFIEELIKMKNSGNNFSISKYGFNRRVTVEIIPSKDGARKSL